MVAKVSYKIEMTQHNQAWWKYYEMWKISHAAYNQYKYNLKLEPVMIVRFGPIQDLRPMWIAFGHVQLQPTTSPLVHSGKHLTNFSLEVRSFIETHRSLVLCFIIISVSYVINSVYFSDHLLKHILSMPCEFLQRVLQVMKIMSF